MTSNRSSIKIRKVAKDLDDAVEKHDIESVLSCFLDDCEVEVFGRKVKPGNLCHADKHGFLLIPDEDQSKILEAARFMDSNECNTLIACGRDSSRQSGKQILQHMEKAISQFNENTAKKFKRTGEW